MNIIFQLFDFKFTYGGGWDSFDHAHKYYEMGIAAKPIMVPNEEDI